MFSYDSGKVFMLQIFIPERSPFTEVVPGNELEAALAEYKNICPKLNKIAVYDADTREAVGIFRP